MQTLIIILNLIILESLLSIDNAAVLAVMVKDLPPNQKPKALRYGLLGAYLFRGLCLFFAAYLIHFEELKIAGGAYLLWLTYSHFTQANDSLEEAVNASESRIFRAARWVGLSRFWATIILVEVMDLAFSIDNVFAAVALSPTFWVVMTGVGIGILAMRFIAGWFCRMMERFPSLAGSAFIVIGLLGLKLIFTGFIGLHRNGIYIFPSFTNVRSVVSSHFFDLIFSSFMMLIFFYPIMKKLSRN